MTLLKVQLALSNLLENYYQGILQKAKAGNVGAVKALSMFTPLKPLIIRELRKLSEEDAAKLVAEVKNFLQAVEE